MKIGFVLDDSLDKTDGVQQYVTTLGHWLSMVGHEVHYLVGESHRTDLAHLHSLSRNIAVNFNGNRVSVPLPVNKSNLRNLLREEMFDVLHVQMPYSPMLGARVIKAAPLTTAIVGTFHIVPFSVRERIATRLLKLFIRRSLGKLHVVMSVSKPAAGFARKSMGIKSVVVPNVVDVQLMRSGQRIKKFDDGKINLVYLGRLVERKGCQYLLQALEQLHQEHHLENVRVLICGKGQLSEKLQDYVRKHHLGNTVHFTGYISESQKANYLASAQIAVFPSLAGESFGIVLIEAMAAGSETIIAGNNAGYRSVLAGQNKQLVNPKDTAAFSKTILHFVHNTKARNQTLRWQHEQISHYDVSRVGQTIIKHYQVAININQRARS